MNRTTRTLIGAVTALAVVTGAAALAAPGEDGSDAVGSSARKPVQRSTAVCPRPTTSDVAETEYSAFTPRISGEKQGSAELFPAEDRTAAGAGRSGKGSGRANGGEGSAQPFLPLRTPGKPVTVTTTDSDAPALVGAADGRFAPGWTVQQTTEVGAGAGRGLQGTACSLPDTEFWFPGASTAEDRQDYVHLTNPDSTSAVVDLELHDKNGRKHFEAGENITVPPHSTVPFLLSTLTDGPVTNGTLHVTTRLGRVGAQVQAVDKKLGGDWLRASARPAPSAVLPGIPGDAQRVRLVVFAPGDRDADLKVRLAGPSGEVVPAGHETLHVKGGMTTAVDLHNLTQGEAGSLSLSPAEGGEGTPVVAALRVTRGKGAKQETAFLPATTPIDGRASAVGSHRTGSLLSLTTTGQESKVRVTSSAGSAGGSPVSKVYRVKGKTTKSVVPPVPKGVGGAYAVTVERLSGGPLYASRTLARKLDGVPAFTVQTLPDDEGTVVVPKAEEDLSVLTQ